MRNYILLAATVIASLATSSSAGAVTVASDRTSYTSIGSVAAGQSYVVSITGESTLCTICNSGGSLRFDSNGVPTIPPVGAYASWGATGGSEDPSTPWLDYGVAGPGFRLGALVFVLAGAEGGASSSPFALQNGATFTTSVDGTLNAIVNDSYYADNLATGFSVSLANVAGAVPEPASWAMMLVGFGAIGAAMRRPKQLMPATA